MIIIIMIIVLLYIELGEKENIQNCHKNILIGFDDEKRSHK